MRILMKQSVLVIATLEAASDNEDDVTDKPAWIGNTPILTPEEVSKLGQRYRQRLRSLQSVDEIASLAGLTPPSFVDGRSLSPLLSTSPPGEVPCWSSTGRMKTGTPTRPA